MTLDKFIKKKIKSITEIADTVEVHYTHILRIAHGKRRPSPGLALEIEKATGGKVTVLELLYPDEKAA